MKVTLSDPGHLKIVNKQCKLHYYQPCKKYFFPILCFHYCMCVCSTENFACLFTHIALYLTGKRSQHYCHHLISIPYPPSISTSSSFSHILHHFQKLLLVFLMKMGITTMSSASSTVPSKKRDDER